MTSASSVFYLQSYSWCAKIRSRITGLTVALALKQSILNEKINDDRDSIYH